MWRYAVVVNNSHSTAKRETRTTRSSGKASAVANETERTKSAEDNAAHWPDEQLAVRIARCYYDLGMTQQQIAQLLDVARARVIRLLAEARQRGIVSITISSPLLDNVYLAEQLIQRYSLQGAEVLSLIHI